MGSMSWLFRSLSLFTLCSTRFDKALPTWPFLPRDILIDVPSWSKHINLASRQLSAIACYDLIYITYRSTKILGLYGSQNNLLVRVGWSICMCLQGHGHRQRRKR